MGGDVMHQDETEITKETPETWSARGDTAGQGATKRFSWWIPIGVALLLTITLVAILLPVIGRGETATSSTDAKSSADGTNTLFACPKVDVDLLPFLGDGETDRDDNISWHYPQTLSYYDLDNECSACYTRNDELVCTDGEKMIFGLYDNATGMGAVLGMSTVCINSTLDLSSLGPVQRGKDIILSDIADGFNVSTTYIREEFNLACEVTGEYEGDHGAGGERELQQNSNAVKPDVPASLPFRGGGKDRKFVDKDTIRLIYPEAYTYYGFDKPQMRCYNNMDQLLCTDGRSLVFSQFVQALQAYAVMGKTAHCINGLFNPRNVNATKRTGDIISDDYLDGISITREYILENTGLECNPVLFRRGLALSGAQCPVGVALKRQNYRQAISGVSGTFDHVHSRSAQSITFSSCGSGYQPMPPQQFSRHVGVGSGEALGYRFHCQDSFAGTQNPLVRLVSATGNTSSIGRLRTAYVGAPGCYYSAKERRITAAYTSCDGYAVDDGIVVPQQANIDEFWIKCPGPVSP